MDDRFRAWRERRTGEGRGAGPSGGTGAGPGAGASPDSSPEPSPSAGASPDTATDVRTPSDAGTTPGAGTFPGAVAASSPTAGEHAPTPGDRTAATAADPGDRPAEQTRAPHRPRTTRRGLLALGGAALAGGAAGAAGVGLSGGRARGHDAAPGSSLAAATAAGGRIPFYGRRQAGIATPAQDRLAFAAYDLTVSGNVAGNRAALIRLLADWTAAAAAMTQGHTVPGDNENPDAPPADTGEAYGLSPSNLTITFGLGPSLFDGRFGLTDRRPAALADLPHLPPAHLDPARSGGDLAVQACADDPVVAFHVIRNLARIGRDSAVMRWSQLGFGNATANGGSGQTPRNLFGFKDGTRNIPGDDTALMDRHVWVGAETDQPWMRDGSYMVARRIQMRIEAWDRDYLADQQNVFGRHKYSGAPLTGADEFDTPDFVAQGPSGLPVIPVGAHIRLAAHENNGGTRILRRGYSYTDGIVPASGELDAGLFFIAYQKDPRTQFVTLQRKLGRSDALNEYIQHTGSGLFACPPAAAGSGHSWAEQLLA